MVDKLSRGMKQRLSLARTLAHDPEVLILDEPASGLDPRARVEIRELLVELAAMGKTIFFSSHILADVSEICTHVGIIEAGQMVIQGSVADMRAQLTPWREIVVTLADGDTMARARSLLEGIPRVLETSLLEPRDERARTAMHYEGDVAGVAALNRALALADIGVLGFQEETKDLESLFMNVTRGVVS